MGIAVTTTSYTMIPSVSPDAVFYERMVAASESTIVDKLKASTRQIEMVGGVIMMIVGVYLIYYFLSTTMF